MRPLTDTLEEMSPRFGWRSYWVNVLLSEILLMILPGCVIILWAVPGDPHPSSTH